MSTLGLDIGGANLKAVFISGSAADRFVQTVSESFAMWEHWKDLSQKLQKISQDFDINCHTQIAVTMTGELADCFTSRREGVVFIANAVQKAFSGHEISFYQTDGNWCGTEAASDNWKTLAASNWHAMAQSAIAFLPDQSGLVIDIGSTTTDVIPIVNGRVVAIGKTDFERLRNQELIYAGIGRTPVCSLIQSVKLDSGSVAVSRELFATTDDALIWLKLILENAGDFNSTDHQSRSRDDAGRRLARMVCSEQDEIGTSVIDRIATTTVSAFELLLIEAIETNIHRHQNVFPNTFPNEVQNAFQNVLLVGTGSFLADRVLKSSFPSLQRIRLRNAVETGCSECGPAYAVAILRQQATAI